VVAAAALVVVVVLATVLTRVGGGPSHVLTVEIGGPNVSAYGLGCEPGDKSDRQFAGAFVTVADSNGETIDLGTADSGGEFTEGSEGGGTGACAWTVQIDDLEDSDFYSVHVELPYGQEREIKYSRTDLEDRDWTVRLDIDL